MHFRLQVPNAPSARAEKAGVQLGSSPARTTAVESFEQVTVSDEDVRPSVGMDRATTRKLSPRLSRCPARSAFRPNGASHSAVHSAGRPLPGPVAERPTSSCRSLKSDNLILESETSLVVSFPARGA